MKLLILGFLILNVATNPTPQKYNYVFLPVQNGNRYQSYPRQNYQPQSRAPSVEIQEVTAEWVCNNYATGEVKFFGLRDLKTTKLSSADVEQLLRHGVSNTNSNVNPANINPNNPFLKPEPAHTEPPNTDGAGIIEPRLGQ